MIQRATTTPRGGGPARRLRLPKPSGEAWAVFGVALAVRLAYVLAVHPAGAQPSSDSIAYDELGWNLARGMGFQFMGESALYPTAKAPLLPWLVSLVYRVTGHVFMAALLAQAVLGAFVPLLVRSLGGSMFNPPVGRLAGWLAAVHPLLVFFSGYLLTENLFSVVVLAAVLASAAWLRHPRAGRAFGAGLLWGLAALTRPTALPLPAAVAAWAWAPIGLSLRPGERTRQVALLLLGTALAIAPWTARNAIVLREFVPITTGGGRTLLDANNAIVWDDPALRGGAISTAEREPWRTRWRNLSEAEVDRAAGAEAVAFGLARWREWPGVAWAKFSRFWRLRSQTPSTGRWFQPGSLPDRLVGLADPLLWWSLVLFPCAMWGLFRTLRHSRRHFQLLPLVVVAMFTVGALVFWGALRLRVPAEPMVLLYASVGLTDLARRFRARRAGLELVARPAGR
jgi:4-amino-4-deoxy-L-arabinose transferase-like glycosyltransferase